MEFSLKEIIEILLKRFVLIVICTFAGFCLFFLYSRFIIKPTYHASVQMYVNSNDTTSITDLNELNYAQKVATTYINFLQTNVFFKRVAEDGKLNYSQQQLKRMTTIKSINNTEIFEISVSATNPDDAYKIVLSMEKVAPVLIKSIKDTAQISVVDPPVLPASPSSPNILINTLAGGLIAFVFAVMAALLFELFDMNVKNQEDLSKRYQLPILGAIPNFNLNKKQKYKLKKNSLKDRFHKKSSHRQTGLNKDSQFIITEAYKSLRSNLNFTLRYDGCKKILVSSPIPEDGKSTTVMNIGISIAQTGARVLLLDCDLRKGKLHHLLNVRLKPGVSDVLSSSMDLQNVICKTTYENLFVMPMGTIPPNPSELLGSIQMEALLNKLNTEYDYIIIDSPPVKVVSDALNLVKMVDGVLLVVREGETSHPSISGTLTKYQFLNANILGFLLNGISLHQEHRYKYHYYN